MTTPSDFPRLRPEDLDDEQRALYDAIAGGPRAAGPFRLVDNTGALTGPFNAMLLSPALGHALQAVGASLRYAGVLDIRCREIAILLVASAWDSAFERYAHEAVSRQAGMDEEILRALRDGSIDGLSGIESVVGRTTLALTRRGRLTAEELSEAREALGDQALYELTTLVGYYATLALQLRVFGDDVPHQV